MNDDSDRMREIQERFAELRQESDAADEELLGTTSDELASPVVPARRRVRWRGWLFIASLLVAIFVFGELALTVQGRSSPDFGDARRIGKATVVSCERQGPVGRGFGFWYRCAADVVWEGGFSGRYTFDRRDFIHADEVGTTFTIGENAGSRTSGVSYSRPEAPHRPLVVGIGLVLAVAAFIPALFLVAAAFSAIRDRLRRQR